MTVLDALIQSLSRAGEYNRDDQVPPAVILWPDKERQWEPLMPVLRERLAHLLTLGAYDVGTRTGPGVWLRCMIARSLPEATWTEKDIPVIYLPGVSRQEFRAVAECPAPLMPLAELQYRGGVLVAGEPQGLDRARVPAIVRWRAGPGCGARYDDAGGDEHGAGQAG